MKEILVKEYCIPAPQNLGVYTDLICPLNQGRWQWTFLFEVKAYSDYYNKITGQCVLCQCDDPSMEGLVSWGADVTISDTCGPLETSGYLKYTERLLKRAYGFFKAEYSKQFPNELYLKLHLAVEKELAPEAKRVKCSRVASSAKLTCSLGSLLQSGLLSDVILSTEGQHINAHQCILAARSDFFKAKFKPEWNGKTVNIDVSLSVLREMLRYMYTGSFREDVDVIQLLVAGDMYLVTDLCDEIKGRLEEGLELGKPIASICDMLKISVTYNSQSLRSVVLKYVKKHRDEVLKSKEWNEFQIANRQVAAEAVLDMFNIPDE